MPEKSAPKEKKKLDPERLIKDLRRQIQHHNHLYYDLSRPKISDQQYDGLLKALERLEKEYPRYAVSDSPTQHVGGKPQMKFGNIRHLVPMLSIENTYSKEDRKSVV